jgi:dihydroxy-acid dehydratase
MSGTSFGTCILHVAPEAAVGGPLAALEDGDMVTVDVERRLLQVELTEETIAARLAARRSSPSAHLRGWPALHEAHVMQAPQGADLDFLVPATDEALLFVEPVIGRS